jgi:hypothetical protein
MRGREIHDSVLRTGHAPVYAQDLGEQNANPDLEVSLLNENLGDARLLGRHSPVSVPLAVGNSILFLSSQKKMKL